ncbi:MAG: FAD-dependent oxidoreductase, partial [Alistipes sp.]|nr:FAD-dependent oxidoreductase [Alistipes sp.]
GDAITDNYMLPYNRKLYGEDLDDLGTYWLEKLPSVSYEETLLSCKEHKPYGKQPGHARFYYPKKYGFGEVFRRMADNLGDRILYNTPVVRLNVEKRSVNDRYEAEYVIVTIPWTAVDTPEGMPEDIAGELSQLKHTSVVVDYFAENMDNKAHWIYYPNEAEAYHRILLRHNFLENAKGYWTETRAERREKFPFASEYSYRNEYAYPLNTIGKNEAVSRILEYCRKKQVIGLGRWGEWQHFNADVVIVRAMELAKKFLFGNSGT